MKQASLRRLIKGHREVLSEVNKVIRFIFSLSDCQSCFVEMIFHQREEVPSNQKCEESCWLLWTKIVSHEYDGTNGLRKSDLSFLFSLQYKPQFEIGSQVFKRLDFVIKKVLRFWCENIKRWASFVFPLARLSNLINAFSRSSYPTLQLKRTWDFSNQITGFFCDGQSGQTLNRTENKIV